MLCFAHQGANFDGENLSDATSNASELVQLDCNVALAYVLNDESGPYAEGTFISTPLYFSTSREQLLVELAMPTREDLAKWVLAGVSLFLYDQ